MASVIYALTIPADVKTYLGETSSTYDTVFQNLINQCTDWIEDYCGNRRFVADTCNGTAYDGTVLSRTEYYDGNEFGKSTKRTIQLRGWPIISITTVSYATGDLDNPTWTDYDPKSQFVKSPLTGELKFFASLPTGYQNMRVVYKAGWAGADLPKNLSLACIQLVAAAFNKRRSQGIEAESIGGGSITWEKLMNDEVKGILDSYRRFSF